MWLDFERNFQYIFNSSCSGSGSGSCYCCRCHCRSCHCSSQCHSRCSRSRHSCSHHSRHCQHHKGPHAKNWYKHKPQKGVETGSATTLWDFHIRTYRTIKNINNSNSCWFIMISEKRNHKTFDLLCKYQFSYYLFSTLFKFISWIIYLQ